MQKEMRKMRGLKSAAVMALCLALLSGVLSCRTPAGRTAGQVVDDTVISTTLKSRLFQDPYLSGFAVSIETFEGEVTLMGAVNTEFAKERATAIAQTVDGVKNIHNLLVVKP